MISKFDGFRVEINQEKKRGDIILSRPPLNIIQYSQRIQIAQSLRDLDKNEDVRIVVLRADGDHFSSGGNIEGFMKRHQKHLRCLLKM